MLINSLINFFGTSSNDEALKTFLLGYGIDISSELRLEDESDDTAYIESPEEGFCLFFTAESSFLKKDDMLVGEGELFLSGIFLHSQDADDYDEFKGDIPKGVRLTDSADLLHKKMGEPTWSRKDEEGNVKAERWDFDFYKMHVTYRKNSDLIFNISVSTYFGNFQPINKNVKQKIWL